MSSLPSFCATNLKDRLSLSLRSATNGEQTIFNRAVSSYWLGGPAALDY